MEANYAGTYRRSMPDNQADLVTLERIRYAAEQIRGVAVRTPLLPWEDGVWLKPESLQPVGAFKMRGAYFRLSTLTDDERSAGVITYSSGNHAQAVARAARLLGISLRCLQYKLKAYRQGGLEPLGQFNRVPESQHPLGV